MENIKKILCSKIFIIFLLFLIGLTGWRFYENQLEITKLRGELNELEKQIEQTQQINQQLREELIRVEDLEYIEEVARDKLGLVKPGETLIIPQEEE